MKKDPGAAPARFDSRLIWSTPKGIADPAQRQRPKNPEHHDGDHSGSADRTLPALVCYRSILIHDLLGNERHHQLNAERHDDQIVEITDHRNEVLHAIDSRERLYLNAKSTTVVIP